jgi:hypothetical protein
MPPAPTAVDPALQRRLGVDLFNRVWTILELDERTPEQVDELVHAAHASAYHWRQVGAPENFARSEWQCSRVYAVLERPEPALHHARRCLELCEQHDIADWDLGFAYEALARAHALDGDGAGTRRWLAQAEEQAGRIAAADDREHLVAELATITRPSD